MVLIKECPICGHYPRSSDRDALHVCGKCGLVFSKYHTRKSFIFLLLFSLLSLFCLVTYTNNYYDEMKGTLFYEKSDFKTTLGTIMFSQKALRSAGVVQMTVYDIVYTYKLGETYYESNQITFSGNFNEYKKYLQKYPRWKSVKVYYDPLEPSFSVLEPDNKGLYFFGGVLFWFLWSVAPWIYFVYRWKTTNLYSRY